MYYLAVNKKMIQWQHIDEQKYLVLLLSLADVVIKTGTTFNPNKHIW